MPASFEIDPYFRLIRKPGPGRGCLLWVGNLWITAILGLLLAVILPIFNAARPGPHGRLICDHNLRMIALALTQYRAIHGALPPACTLDANGRRLHGWRTLILPYLDEKGRYDQIDLSKPWDDPVNLRWSEPTPFAYRCPMAPDRPGMTTYLATTAPDGCLIPGKPRRPAEITDRPGETVMVLEAGKENAVPWMAPVDADLPLVLGLSPASKLHHEISIGMCFMDGSLHYFRPTLPADVRRALYTISGGETVSKDRDDLW
ncbi:DUF1559 family PulG-like putative transporter [Aquisphaera insulae]|uniref:DUF1559 family PulG-like putative transporter n=1 Tax=Aquisphaera insulae TaxID=2712864 RepID=UPI0013EBB42F|nr:DUF1559 domain-containing protein [Aquisphaera insulae]